MRGLLAAAAIVALGVGVAACGGSGSGLPEFTASVVDDAGVIDDAVETSLNATLENFRANVGPQIAVLVVNSTGNKSLEDYSIDIARDWGIGDEQRDDGVLLLIAIDDRVLRIETGSGIEGDLTDVEAGRIIDSVVVPALRSGNPTAAVSAGVKALTTELSGQTFDYPDQAPATTTDTGSAEANVGSIIFGLMILAFFGIGILGTVIRGRRRGLGALDILSLVYVFTRSSGGFGGGRGFGGGGGGGFSGGGASGSW